MLPKDYWKKIDDSKEYAVLFGADKEPDIGWDTLVRRARFQTRTVRYSEDDKPVVDPESKTTKKEITGYTDHDAVLAYQHVECDLCKLFGKEMMHSHTTDDCWANPYSSRYRRNVYEARLLECYRKKMPVPEIMKVYEAEAKNTPAPKPSGDAAPKLTKNQDLAAMLKNSEEVIVQALRDIIDNGSDADTSYGIDHIPDPRPVCMFTHTDDGAESTNDSASEADDDKV